MTLKNEPELGGVFVWIGGIGGMLLGIEAAAPSEALVGAGVGFLTGAFVGRVVERVVWRLLVLGVTGLVIYLRLHAWGVL